MARPDGPGDHRKSRRQVAEVAHHAVGQRPREAVFVVDGGVDLPQWAPRQRGESSSMMTATGGPESSATIRRQAIRRAQGAGVLRGRGRGAQPGGRRAAHDGVRVPSREQRRREREGREAAPALGRLDGVARRGASRSARAKEGPCPSVLQPAEQRGRGVLGPFRGLEMRGLGDAAVVPDDHDVAPFSWSARESRPGRREWNWFSRQPTTGPTMQLRDVIMARAGTLGR